LCHARSAVAQPGHGVRLWADVRPSLERLVELLAAGLTEDVNLSLLLGHAKPCNVELACVAHPGRAVARPMQANAPPQPEIALLRGYAAWLGEIEAAQRSVTDASIRAVCLTSHLVTSWEYLGTTDAPNCELARVA